jgi:TetR/AcrR family transcriptional regulator
VSTVAAPARRIGTKDSKTRAQLVVAAERLLLREGYAAVTSRRVAAEADLKPQLVHYYFRTMDDLFLEVFRRRADANVERLERLLADGPTLQALWAMNADPRGAAFMVEFTALANHRKPIRKEVARYAERFRALQQDALASALARAGVAEAQMPPMVALLLMTGLGQVLGLERLVGVKTGHAETFAFIEQAIALMEGATGG